jgi:hypothetical protein
MFKYIRVTRYEVYLRNKSWKPECVLSFNMDWRILVSSKLEILNIFNLNVNNIL